ncbi:MAG: hypothetical protein ACOC00_07920 [Halothiobacillaceae bacterium]
MSRGSRDAQARDTGPGQPRTNRPGALLIIGVHEEELAFGEQVAQGMSRRRIDLLRIPKGISGRHPRPDQRFYYKLQHQEIYHQLLKIVEREHYSLVIDLHAGVDSQKTGADVYCPDSSLRDCLGHAMQDDVFDSPPGGPMVRMLALTRSANNDGPSVETVIPTAVWNNDRFRYVGLEIYLRHRDGGTEREWAFARLLIARILDCGLSDGNGPCPWDGDAPQRASVRQG